MKVFQCDRCGKIYDEIDQAKQQDRLFWIYEKARITSTEGRLDLCDECYQSFLDFMHDVDGEDKE